MGRKRSRDTDLPPRLHRKRRGQKVYFYYVTSTTPRRWVPLGTDKRKALAEYARLEAADSAAIAGTFAALLDLYLAQGMTHLAAATQRSYQKMAPALRQVFGHVQASKITPHHIYQYHERRAAQAPTMARREVALMGAVMAFGVRWGGWGLSQNPVREVRLPKKRARDRYVTDAEYLAIWHAAPELVRVVMDLTYVTAARKSQVLALPRANVTDEGVWIDPAKNGKLNLYHWTPELREVINRALALPGLPSATYVISNKRGQPYTPNGFESMFQRAKRTAGVEDMRYHDLRAKAATDYDQRGEDAVKLLAHRNPKTSETYLRDKRPNRLKGNASVQGKGGSEEGGSGEL